ARDELIYGQFAFLHNNADCGPKAGLVAFGGGIRDPTITGIDLLQYLLHFKSGIDQNIIRRLKNG
ncbi:MAG: hypothetical protein EZS28_040098, partial [Streblomastix strix]